MQTRPQCNLCFLRQCEEAARYLKLTQHQTHELKNRAEKLLQTLPDDAIPPLRASRVHALIREWSNNPDPYLHAKQRSTQHALSLYPELKQRLQQLADPLDGAIRLAIAGNIIDLGISATYDLEANIERVLSEPLAIDEMAQLKQAIADTNTILYLADNAGETVFDRLLIETLPIPVTYVVKGGPAINDATLKDAVEAGIDQSCTIIDQGAATLGTLLDECSSAFRDRFFDAPLVISKGMANYESLAHTRSRLFFLFQAKCEVIAEHLGVAHRGVIVMEDRL
jgi:damage-control phosphatase, subfamily I